MYEKHKDQLPLPHTRMCRRTDGKNLFQYTASANVGEGSYISQAAERKHSVWQQDKAGSTGCTLEYGFVQSEIVPKK